MSEKKEEQEIKLKYSESMTIGDINHLLYNYFVNSKMKRTAFMFENEAAPTIIKDKDPEMRS